MSLQCEILNADSDRLVENGITIICSSMPAFASFSKAWALHSGYFTSLYSRLFSHFNLSIFKDKSSSLASSETRANHFRANPIRAHANSHEQFLFGFEDSQGLNRYPLNSLTTEVHGAAGTDDIESGIIKKSVTVLQTST